jgi:hypothetical protein
MTAACNEDLASEVDYYYQPQIMRKPPILKHVDSVKEMKKVPI